MVYCSADCTVDGVLLTVKVIPALKTLKKLVFFAYQKIRIYKRHGYANSKETTCHL